MTVHTISIRILYRHTSFPPDTMAARDVALHAVVRTQERLVKLREQVREEDKHDSTLGAVLRPGLGPAAQARAHEGLLANYLESLKAFKERSGGALPGIPDVDDMLKDPRKPRARPRAFGPALTDYVPYMYERARGRRSAARTPYLVV